MSTQRKEGDDGPAAHVATGYSSLVRSLRPCSWAEASHRGGILSLEAVFGTRDQTLNPTGRVVPMMAYMVPYYEQSGHGFGETSERILRLMATVAGHDKPFQGIPSNKYSDDTGRWRKLPQGRGRLIYVPIILPLEEPR